MKMKKFVITLLTILIVMLAMIGESFAANSFSPGLTPNSSKVNKGAEVKVTFKISSISVSGGINGLTATLKYDSDVLSIDKTGIKELNDWTVTFNEQNGNIALEKADPIEEDEELATFTFKVADNTQATSSTIKLVSIKGANSSLEDEVSVSDISTTISIASGNSGVISPSATNSGTPSPSNTVSPIPSNTNTASPSNNTQSPSAVPSESPSNSGQTTNNGTMPYTGSEPSYVIPLLAVLAVLGIISFVNYKKIDNK